MLFEKEDLKVRSLQEKDKHLLVKWLSTSSVLEFYEGRDHPFDLDKVNRKFYDKDKEIIKCIVEYRRISIGYVQYYEVNERTSIINEYKANELTYGMDQFIGEPAFWNKGIGTLMIGAMTQYLVNEGKVNNVIMDPQATNIRAIRCYEKAGFRKVKLLPKHEWHEGEYRDCWLMEFQKTLD